MLGVLEIEENLFFRRRFDAKYLHQVSYLLDARKKPTSIVEKAVSVSYTHLTLPTILLV